MVSRQHLLSGHPVCNFMIHPSVRVAAHNKYLNEVKNTLQYLTGTSGTEAFRQELKQEYDCYLPTKMEAKSFKEVYGYVHKLLQENLVHVMTLNGKSDVDSSMYAKGSNIIIGGNTLGRGVTFGSLETVLYTRTSRKPQADTMWQHSRMFGYDRDPGMVCIFIEASIYELFTEINATNNAMIAQIERGVEKVHIYYPNGLNPTRKNVMDLSKVSIIPGGKNFFPYEVDNDNIAILDKMMASFDDKEVKYQVSLQLVDKLLSHILVRDFPLTAFRSFIQSFTAQNPREQAVLLVRRNRDIRRGSRALLSPDDWNIGEQIHDKVVLTMYQVTGNPEKGWDGKKVWVPNIKLPDDIAYYDVKKSENDATYYNMKESEEDNLMVAEPDETVTGYKVSK